MSLLTDTDLRGIIRSEAHLRDSNSIVISPFSEDSLTPVGYDLRVGGRYSSALDGGPFEIKEGQTIAVAPRDTVLVTTLERIGMPRDRTISALIVSRVSKVSQGLSHIATTIDPDWEGELLIAVHNHSRTTVDLRFGEPFCTAVFFENKSPATKECLKVPGRLDIFVRNLSDAARKTQRKEKATRWIPVAIIAVAAGSGYAIFGNNPGFIAMVAAGVALSQIFSFMTRRLP